MPPMYIEQFTMALLTALRHTCKRLDGVGVMVVINLHIYIYIIIIIWKSVCLSPLENKK